MIAIVLSILVGFQATANDDAKKTESPHTKWIEDWKEVRSLSFQDRSKACEKFKTLPWLGEFPHQDLIEFKKSEYCKEPPALNPASFDSLMDLARYQREDFKYNEALKLLNRAFKKAKTDSQRLACLEEQLKVHRSQQNKKMRLSTVKKMAKIDSEKYTLDYARTLWTYNQIKKAQAELRKADKQWKKGVSRQGIYYIQGRILEEQKQPEEALKFYEKALLEPDTNSEIATQLFSSVAWWQFKKENYQRSAELWKQLAEKTKERFAKTRALYWQAQSLLKFKKPEVEQAQKLFKEIIQEDPLSYYAVLAHRDLGEPFKPVAAFKGPARDLKKISWFRDNDADKFEWSLKLEEKLFADTILNSYASKFHDASKSDQRTLLENYWQASLTNSIIRLINSAPPEKREQFYDDHQNLLFPSKYEVEIQKVSEAEKMDPSFVLSLIRQESGFNPMARSPTDALGLMQLMPTVARKIAEEKGLSFQEETELFNPDLNIKLGIRELKNRLQEFGGSPVLAAASYNAGSDAVRGWIKSRYRSNLVEFIEEIPYEETRSYVRLILRNQIFYKRLLEKKPFTFPETSLAAISPAPK